MPRLASFANDVWPAQDAALVYGLTAKPGGDKEGVPVLVLPRPLLPTIARPLSGLKAGVYWEVCDCLVQDRTVQVDHGWMPQENGGYLIAAKFPAMV
jgi:hypothetical protein